MYFNVKRRTPFSLKFQVYIFLNTNNALGCINVIYYTVITDMLWPLNGHYSGWREQEYKHNYNVYYYYHQIRMA